MTELTLEALEKLERKLTVSVPYSEYLNSLNAHLKEIGGRVRIDGFRKGKIPLSVLKARYAQEGKRNALSELAQQAFADAVQQHGLKPVAAPSIESESVVEPSQVRFELRFEVYPEVENISLAGEKIKRYHINPTEKDIDDVIEDLRRRSAEGVPVKRKSRKGDRVWYAPKPNALQPQGAADARISHIDLASQSPSKWVSKFTGVSAGDEVNLAPPLVSQDIAIVVERVEKLELPQVNEAFFKRFDSKIETEDSFREHLHRVVEKEFATREETAMRHRLWEVLLKKAPIDIPTTLVYREYQNMAAQAGLLDAQGGPQALNQTTYTALLQASEKKVRLGLLVTALIKKRNIKLDLDRVNALIESRQADYDDPQRYRQFINQSHNRQALENEVMEQQLVENLLEEMTVNTHERDVRAYMKEKTA